MSLSFFCRKMGLCQASSQSGMSVEITLYQVLTVPARSSLQVHSMDFDDTWHPATHPSGAVLPALLAIAQMLPGNAKPSGMDLLLAFNVGIEIQGRLMRFSNEAQNIPNR